MARSQQLRPVFAWLWKEKRTAQLAVERLSPFGQLELRPSFSEAATFRKSRGLYQHRRGSRALDRLPKRALPELSSLLQTISLARLFQLVLMISYFFQSSLHPHPTATYRH
jgi:hypothetical protein